MDSDVTHISELPSPRSAEPGLQFGELLVQRRLITPEDLHRALEEQRKNGGRLGEVLLRLEVIDDSTLTNILAEHLAIERINLEDLTEVDARIARMLPEGIAKRFCLLAIGEENSKLVVAMADPLDVFAIDTVDAEDAAADQAGRQLRREINRAIDLIYHSSDIEERQLRDLIALETDSRRRSWPRTSLVEESPRSTPAAKRRPIRRRSFGSSICC